MGAEGAQGERFVDRLISSALHSSVRHGLLLILFRRFGAFPSVLAATENVPGRSDITAYVRLASKNLTDIDAARRASLQRDRRHECTGGGGKIRPGRLSVGLRGLNTRSMVE